MKLDPRNLPGLELLTEADPPARRILAYLDCVDAAFRLCTCPGFGTEIFVLFRGGEEVGRVSIEVEQELGPELWPRPTFRR